MTAGYVVVNFEEGILPFCGVNGFVGPRSSAPGFFKGFPTREEAERHLELVCRVVPKAEVHPWPLPQEAIQRLKDLHPAENWSWLVSAEELEIILKNLNKE